MSLALDGPQPFFDDAVDHMAINSRAPIALIALAGNRRQWLSAAGERSRREVSPDETFDALRLLGTESRFVNDTASLENFDEQGETAQRSRIRAFVAEPLVHEGEIVGALYLADTKPREWTDFETDYLKRSSRLILAHVEARAVLAERGRRIELERELGRLGELYRTVFEHVQEGVTVVSAEGELIAFNPASLELLGLTAEQMQGRALTTPDWKYTDETGSVIPHDQNNALVAQRTGQPQLGVVQGVNLPSGEWRWMHVNSIPLSKLDGDAKPRVVSTFRDITDERNAARQLKDALEAAEAAVESKQQFLADISHEIRTPLNGVVGLAQALKMTKLDEEQTDLVDTILESGTMVTSLLDDVLDLSKIESGKFEISPSQHDVGEFLASQVKLWRPRAREKGLYLTLDIGADVPERLSFDGVRVQQCLSNLISNAIKFTKEGGVTVQADAVEDADGTWLMTLRVFDTGIGLSKAALAKLFEPFTQADKMVSSQHGGTGLGLSITRNLAELMGGEASAKSELGRGSEFRFTFKTTAPVPLQEPRPSGVAAVDESDDGQARMKVLVVDDNAINRRVVSLLVQAMHADVCEVENGLEAVQAVEREKFDLILLDMHMPVMDGQTAIARIRAMEGEPASTPVIAVTADSSFGEEERYLSLGLDGFAPKPLNARDFLTEIHRVLEGANGTPLRDAS